MTYETLVMYGRELIGIPESTVVGCSCEQNFDRNSLRIPLPSALLSKFQTEKLKKSKDRMQQKKRAQIALGSILLQAMMVVKFLQNSKAIQFLLAEFNLIGIFQMIEQTCDNKIFHFFQVNQHPKQICNVIIILRPLCTKNERVYDLHMQHMYCSYLSIWNVIQTRKYNHMYLWQYRLWSF